MQDKVFRKTSIDRISSPEQLNEYMKVVTPSVWLVLGAVVIILIGILVWGCFGTIKSKLSVVVSSDGSVATYCYVPSSRRNDVSEGMAVVIDGNVYALGSWNWMDLDLYSAKEIGKYMTAVGGYSEDEYFACIPLKRILPAGVYKGEIILKEINPVKFLLNSGADNE